MKGVGRIAKLEHASSDLAELGHLLPQGRRWLTADAGARLSDGKNRIGTGQVTRWFARQTGEGCCEARDGEELGAGQRPVLDSFIPSNTPHPASLRSATSPKSGEGRRDAGPLLLYLPVSHDQHALCRDENLILGVKEVI